MSRSRKIAGSGVVPTDLDAALATMSADALREVVRELLLELDERAHARVVGSLIARAARGGFGWAPAAVSDEQVAEERRFGTATPEWRALARLAKKRLPCCLVSGT